MSLKIDIDWKKVYMRLCEKCKQEFKKYLKERIAEQLTDELLGEKGEKEE